MKLFVLSAFCLMALLRIFCSLLLRDKTFLSGESKPVYICAVCIALSAFGGACGGGYILSTVTGGYQNVTLLTAFSAVAAVIIAVIIALIAKKIFALGGIYLPALILCPVLSGVMTSLTFAGASITDLAISAAASACSFAIIFVLWHAVKLGTSKLKHGFILEGVCIAAAVTTVLSVL